MKEVGLTPGDWGPEKQFREEIREKEGKDFVVKRIIQETRELIAAGQHRVVLDGLYTWTEYKALKHEFPGEMTVIAVVAPKHLRYRRMENRPERPMTSREVDTRDWAEIENMEKGGPIAIADYFIHNDKDLEWLHAQLNEVLDHSGFNK
jgi:dephospho-CoA kinase